MKKWTPRAGDLVADRFKLTRELTRGGMGAIWLAEHTGLDIQCVLKFIQAEDDITDEHRQRFRQEARAAAKLKSRFVVHMYDYGVWEGAPYIAMELLEGVTLADRMEMEGVIDVDETLTIMRGVARALSSASELGIVHRDLKPENVFLISEGGEMYPKVLDFGVAKLTEPMKLDANYSTKTGSLVGTPWYMSPEQIDGTIKLDARSDLFAAAVMTYECLTGRLPFESEAFGNLMLKICNGPRPVPSDHAPELPIAFDEWWARAAEKEPGDRFQTPTEWYAALTDAFAEVAAPRFSGGGLSARLGSHRAESQSFDAPTRRVVNAKTQVMSHRGAETFSGQSRSSGSHDRGRMRLAAVGALALVGAGAFALWRVGAAGSDPQGDQNVPSSASTHTAVAAEPVASAAVEPTAIDSAAATTAAAASSAIATAESTASASAAVASKPRPTTKANPYRPRPKPKSNDIVRTLPPETPPPKVVPPAPRPGSTTKGPDDPGF